jgi:VPDSG-CTERM motif
MKTKAIAVFTSLVGMATVSAFAQSGTLPAGNDFGGNGIPIDTVQVSTISLGNDTITLGLDATQRNPAPPIQNNGDLYNNGSGTYFAAPGEQWNFDFYAGITGGGNFQSYNFVLNYAIDPGTPTGSLGSWSLNGSTASTATSYQNSEYPGFAFLSNNMYAPTITEPGAGYDNPYNVNATGDYTFILDAYNDGVLIGSDEITVEVDPVPDAASTLGLMCVGLGALAGLRRRLARA